MGGSYGIKLLEERAFSSSTADATHYARKEHSVVRDFLAVITFTVENSDGVLPHTPDASVLYDGIFGSLKYVKGEKSYCTDVSGVDLHAVARVLGRMVPAIPVPDEIAAGGTSEINAVIPFALADLRSDTCDGEVDLIEIESLRIRIPVAIDWGDANLITTNIVIRYGECSREGAIYGQRRYLETADDQRSHVDHSGQDLLVGLIMYAEGAGDEDLTLICTADGYALHEHVPLRTVRDFGWLLGGPRYPANAYAVPIVGQVAGEAIDTQAMQIVGAQVDPSTVKAGFQAVTTKLSAAPAEAAHYVRIFLEPVASTLARRAPSGAAAAHAMTRLIVKGPTRDQTGHVTDTHAISNRVGNYAPRRRSKGY